MVAHETLKFIITEGEKKYKLKNYMNVPVQKLADFHLVINTNLRGSYFSNKHKL